MPLFHCLLACIVRIEKSVIPHLFGAIYFSVWKLINRTIILLPGFWDFIMFPNFTICSLVWVYFCSNLGALSINSKWIAWECLKGKKFGYQNSERPELEEGWSFVLFFFVHTILQFLYQYFSLVLRCALCYPVQSKNSFALPEDKLTVIFLNWEKGVHWWIGGGDFNDLSAV